MISTKTVRWQCSGCDHLCALLIDDLIIPEQLIKCELSKWREERLSKISEVRNETEAISKKGN